MLATSALFTSVSFLSLRMRPGAFVPIKWRLPECPRLILPLAVILKRFLAPRCVFNFNFGFDAFLGIAGNPLRQSYVPLAAAGGASPSPTKSLLRFDGASLLRLLSAGRRLARGFGDAYAFFRREQGHQDVAFHARHGFDLPLVANFHQQAVHLGAPDFLVRHFAPAMKNHRAHFVAFAEEPQDLALANLIIVFRGSRPKLDFL